MNIIFGSLIYYERTVPYQEWRGEGIPDTSYTFLTDSGNNQYISINSN